MIKFINKEVADQIHSYKIQFGDIAVETPTKFEKTLTSTSGLSVTFQNLTTTNQGKTESNDEKQIQQKMPQNNK